MIEIVSLLKDLLGIIDNKKNPKSLNLPKGMIQGTFKTDEMHPASKYPLRKDQCKK